MVFLRPCRNSLVILDRAMHPTTFIHPRKKGEKSLSDHKTNIRHARLSKFPKSFDTFKWRPPLPWPGGVFYTPTAGVFGEFRLGLQSKHLLSP